MLRGAGSGEDGTLIFGAAKYDWDFAQWTQPAMIHIAAPVLKGVGLMYGDWNGAPGQDWYTGTWHGWREREFVIHQVVTVEAVEGEYIRIKERAEWTYRLEHSIEIFPFHYIENVGVEDMRLEIVITPRDDRWDSNGKGMVLAHVRNGWVDNIVFVNMQSGLNLSSTMNVTASNVRLEGEPFHDSFKFLAAKYSLMENAVINNFRILEDGSIKNTDHGFAAQHHAQLNVYLDPVMPPNCSIDLHSGEPFANLYDRVLGGRHSGSGGAAMTLHALPYHTFWNWSIKATDRVPYQFPVWTGSQVQPYTAWNLHLTGTSYRIGVAGSIGTFPQAPRLVARDIHGNWAMLDQALVSGMNTFDLAGKAWINLPSQYQTPSNAAGFDVTQVTAVGIAHHRQRMDACTLSASDRAWSPLLTRTKRCPATPAPSLRAMPHGVLMCVFSNPIFRAWSGVAGFAGHQRLGQLRPPGALS